MGVADRLVLDRAQPEALVGVVGRLLEPSVVEHQHLGLGVFEVELAFVSALEAAYEMSARIVPVEAGTVEKRQGRCGHDRIRIEGVQPNIATPITACGAAASAGPQRLGISASRSRSADALRRSAAPARRPPAARWRARQRCGLFPAASGTAPAYRAGRGGPRIGR